MSSVIQIFGLGGTILSGFTENGIMPKYPLEEVLQRVLNGSKQSVTLRIEELARKDSNNHDEADIDTLLIRTHHALLDSSIDAIIVTMGTDRMADLAALLEFSITPVTKPVIFTGSMHTIEHERSDIQQNIQHAIALIERMRAERMIENGEVYTGTMLVLGKYAMYAHSSYKVSTKDDEPFICAWNKPFAVFDDTNITIKKATLEKREGVVPRLCLPQLYATRIEDTTLGYKPNLYQLADTEAIVYIGTGDGNFSADLRGIMALLSTQFAKPQFICSSVPKRAVSSLYEAGVAPAGVIQSVLPVSATYTKLAVILRQAQTLTGRIKQEFVLRCFEEDIAGEYKHLRS